MKRNEEHVKMVQAMMERQEKEHRDECAIQAVNLLLGKIANDPLNQVMIDRELSALATLFKMAGRNADDFTDAVMHIEDQIGFKLVGRIQ